MKRLIFGFLVWMMSIQMAFAQVSSVQDGDWNDPNTWDCACVPDFNNGAITVINNVTVPTAFSVTVADLFVNDGASGTLTIDGDLTINGGSLILTDDFSSLQLLIVSATGSITVNATGSLDLSGLIISLAEISGEIINSGSIIVADPAILSFLANSIYYHRFTTGGDIPLATWDANSTCEINDLSAAGPAAPNNLNQDFGNFQWNCPAMGATTTFTLGGQLQTISGNLIFITAGGRSIRFNSAGISNLSIGNNFENRGVALIVTNGTTSGTVNIDVDGDFIMTPVSGTPSFTFGAGAGNTVNVNLNVAGDFSRTAGSISKGTASGIVNLIFDGVLPQTYTFTGTGTITTAINYSISTGSDLDLGTSNLTGSGTLTVNGTIRVGSLDASGAIQSITTAGNIRVSGTRTYNSGSSIVYNGSGAQVINSGHPTNAGVHTIINNSSGASLLGNSTLGGNLVLTSGNLTVGANTLTLGGNVTANGNFIVVVPGSSLVINGSGVLGTFPFPAGDHTISDFTLNRSSGSVTFANNITISGIMTLTVGDLIFNNQTLTLNGSFSAGSGALSGNSASTLSIGGDGPFGSLAFASGGNVINTLTFDRGTSGSGSINSSLTITNALNLTNGDFTNTSGLALDNGATLTRNSVAQLLGSDITVGPGEFYNVVYEGGAFSTGLELPSTIDNDLMDLTVNGGPVTLTQDIIVNGNLTLQNSSFNGNGFVITMAGNPAVWDRQAGSFIPGASTVIISGNTTIQGASASFGNLTVNAGATLSANALLNINNNLQFDAASTFNHNNGIIRFNGTGTQVLAGAGKNLYNIQVNKSAGVVQVSSTVNLINELDIQTSTEVQSNGSLVLISTSDGTSGNARIDALPAGASVTGNITSQRYMSNEGSMYRYISSAVSGAAVSALQDDFPITGPFTGTSYPCAGCLNNASMFYYNETQAGGVNTGYVGFPTASNTETLTPGMGYAAYIRQNIVVTPVTIDLIGPVNQGTVSLPVTYTNNGDPVADGYNLVGNPYPSSIDWDNGSGWTKTNMSNTIAVMDNGSGGVFQYWNGTTGGLTDGVIAAGQGFWVQANGLGGPVLQVNEAAKVTSTGTFFRMKPQEIDVLEITLSKGIISDKAYYQLSKKSKQGLDNYDARKLDNVNFDLSILSVDGTRMAINATNKLFTRGISGSIPLNIKDMAKGTYTFSISKIGRFEDYSYFLLDRYSGKNIDLQQIPEYTFTVTSEQSTSAADRFELFVFKWYPHNNTTLGEMDVERKFSVKVFPNPATDRVCVKVTGASLKEVVLLNMMGAVKERITMTGIDNHTWEGCSDLTNQLKGIYMLRVTDAKGKIFTEKILKK